MREVVFINLGQAGVQISNAIWELFCIEHGIGSNGRPYDGKEIQGVSSLKTVFHEAPSGQYVPRVVTADLEPSVIDEVRTGSYRSLFHPDQLLSGCQDASNNYARGHFTIGRKLIDACLSQIRRVANICDSLQGFVIVNSLGGGTGSGFSTLVCEKLSVEFSKRLKYQIGVYPSQSMETSVVSPYNTIMNVYSSMETCDMSILMDNEAAYFMASNLLNVQRPTFTNINRLFSQVLSSMTVSLRFENSLNSDLSQLCTNLIPYPRIHFPTSHMAPILNQYHLEHETIDEYELTRSVFSSPNSFIKMNYEGGRLMACVLQYRGAVSPKAVNNAIYEIKRRNDICFVDWCPTGFKIGINSFPPAIVNGSDLAKFKRNVTMLSNSSGIVQMWTNLMNKFDLLYAKRSFVFWFVGEGMEEGEFSEARDCIEMIRQDYDEVSLSNEELEEEVDGRPSLYPPGKSKSYDSHPKPMSKDYFKRTSYDSAPEPQTKTSDAEDEEEEDYQEEDQEEGAHPTPETHDYVTDTIQPADPVTEEADYPQESNQTEEPQIIYEPPPYEIEQHENIYENLEHNENEEIRRSPDY